jgi:hypothetical protein
MSTGHAFWGTLTMVLLAFCLHNLLNVGQSRHPGRHQCTTHEHLVGMDHKPSIFVLMIESRFAQSGPCLLERDLLHTLQDAVGNFRAPVRDATPLPFRRLLHDILFCEEAFLSPGKRPAQGRKHQNQRCFHVHPGRCGFAHALLDGSNHAVPAT